MQIIPVLDIRQGLVVRGVAGQRDHYRPITSRLSARPEPLAVATAIRDTFHLNRLYVADLDAIVDRRPNRQIVRQLVDKGFQVLLDAGVRNSDDVAWLAELSGVSPIVGLETIADPQTLDDVCRRLAPVPTIFSLDLAGGQPLGARSAWHNASALEVALRAANCGAQHIIVLELTSVGTGQGVPTLELCTQIRKTGCFAEIITGGGVRATRDLPPIEKAGVDGVLIASALHDGRITSDLHGPQFGCPQAESSDANV